MAQEMLGKHASPFIKVIKGSFLGIKAYSGPNNSCITVAIFTKKYTIRIRNINFILLFMLNYNY